MMGGRVWMGLLAIVLGLTAGAMWAGRAAAQVPNGSISGTVLQDVNNDGTCAATGAPGPAGIPVEFVTGDGFTRVFRETAAGGAFVLNAAGFGVWNVRVAPGSGYEVTTPDARQVVVTQEVPHVAGLVFCVVGAPDGGGSGEDGGTVLPGTGAGLAPGVVMVGLAGLALIGIGVGLIGFARRRVSG